MPRPYDKWTECVFDSMPSDWKADLLDAAVMGGWRRVAEEYVCDCLNCDPSDIDKRTMAHCIDLALQEGE